MKFKINNTQQTSSGFLKVISSEVTFDSFVVGEQITATREMMDRGDSVAVLIYERDTESLLFTNQFRYPAAQKDQHDGFANAGWLLELPAGGLQVGEDPAEAAIREVEEELGYHISGVTFISSFYVSPGGTSERIFLYYAEVNSSDKKSKGGGLIYEKEDIELHKIQISLLKEDLNKGVLRDAKTIIGLQWFMMTHPTFFSVK